MKMRRCEDEKMFYRPPLLEEPCAQTLSGKTKNKKSKNRKITEYEDFMECEDLAECVDFTVCVRP